MRGRLGTVGGRLAAARGIRGIGWGVQCGVVGMRTIRTVRRVLVHKVLQPVLCRIGGSGEVPYGRRGVRLCQTGIQIGDDLRHRLRSVSRLLGQHSPQHGLERFRAVGASCHQRRNRLAAVRQDSFQDGLARKDRTTGQQEEERAAQAIDVRAVVGRTNVFGLFRRHVIDRSQDLTSTGEVHTGGTVAEVLVEPGQSHVEDFYHTRLAQQQVARLHVAMNNAVAMGVFQAAGRLLHVVDGLAKRQRPVLADNGG